MSTEDINPLDAIRERADALNLEGDERDDFIESRMRRAGFKRGPGEWISVEDDDDDEPKDDDDEPVTRGEYRRIMKEARRASVTKTPPKKETPNDTEKEKTKPAKKDAWW